MIKSFNCKEVTIFKPDTGWFVATAEIEGEDNDFPEEVKLVGTSILPPHGMITAEVVEEDSKFGHQYRCVKPIEYHDLESITLTLLESGLIKGINEKKSKAVFEAFGSDIWRILSAAVDFEDELEWNAMTIEFKGSQRRPLNILTDAKGVGLHVAGEMIESWKEERQVFTSAMGAIRCGLTLYQFRNIIRDHGGHERFYKMLHNEPPFSIYDMVTYGITWEKADKLALEDWPDKPAIAWDSPVRFAGAVKVILRRYANDGHMCVPVDVVNELAEELIGSHNVMSALDKPEEVGLRVSQGYVYTAQDYELEAEIAWRIRSINRGLPMLNGIPDADDIQEYAEIDLHENQLNAIIMALMSKVSVITGGPGVGKTTILKVLADYLTDKGVEVTLCAFMGSAARRMKIATGHPAHTLHKFFELYKDKDDRHFLKAGYLFIDEMSTVPADLLRDVLAQCGDDVHVVFIGDMDQLPPVGRGEVFVQLLESGIPQTRLTHLFRNGGAIAQACRDVNLGQMPKGDNKDFYLINQCAEKDITSRLLAAEEFFNKNGWRNAQTITPLNGDGKKEASVVSSVIGRKQLNEVMQSQRNPNGEPIPYTDIRVGDIVVQLRNNYELEVRNGMVGQVVARTDEARMILSELEAQRKDPEKESPSWMTQNQISIMDVLFQEEDNVTNYMANHMDEIKLGYAITVHKSQGNQFPYVFVVLPASLLYTPLCLRQIVYTAMSRAKSKLVVIASPGVIERCIENTTVLRRYSNLAFFIQESYEMEPV